MTLDFCFATLMLEKLRENVDFWINSIIFQKLYAKPSYYLNVRANESLVQICKNLEIIWFMYAFFKKYNLKIDLQEKANQNKEFNKDKVMF